MSAEDARQPGVAEQAARHAASYAAQQIAQQALVKAGALLGAKGAAVVAAVMVIIALIMLLIVSVVGAAVQRTTAVWPVPVATDAAGNYLASGWMISSRYGWRDDPQGAGAEFHDGLDLANPQGVCPFGYHCGAPSMFDGSVQYVGWDQAAAGDPSKTGGGELVIVSNGQDDHQTISRTWSHTGCMCSCKAGSRMPMDATTHTVTISRSAVAHSHQTSAMADLR